MASEQPIGYERLLAVFLDHGAYVESFSIFDLPLPELTGMTLMWFCRSLDQRDIDDIANPDGPPEEWELAEVEVVEEQDQFLRRVGPLLLECQGPLFTTARDSRARLASFVTLERTDVMETAVHLQALLAGMRGVLAGEGWTSSYRPILGSGWTLDDIVGQEEFFKPGLFSIESADAPGVPILTADDHDPSYQDVWQAACIACGDLDPALIHEDLVQASFSAMQHLYKTQGEDAAVAFLLALDARVRAELARPELPDFDGLPPPPLGDEPEPSLGW